MKYLVSFILLCVMTFSSFAQKHGDPKFKQKFNKADALTFDGSYLVALPLLEDLYAYDTSNANLNYLLGVCYLMGKKDASLAIKRLENATKNVSLEYSEANWKERKAPGLAYLYLGKAYHSKNKFDRAVTNYYNYRSFIEMDDVATYNKVRQLIQYAENAIELVKNPVGVKITNLGSTINTQYSDYCPVVSADGKVLIFTSKRAGGTSDAQDPDGNYYDDIYVCHKQANGKWSAPKSIGANINSNGHEAAIGLSPDGQLLYIYKDDNNDGNIYFSKRNGEDWTKPQPLGSDINTTSWETHATVNATQDMLIFVSNRSKGGYGGRDLWYCKKLPNGEWGLALNMGSVINSQYEEDSPFISADGNTLIFSSQGHTSMGGFDIFRSEFVEGAWTLPENIGYPINTSEDDVFFSLTPDGRHAYYSSRMDGGYGDTDLYKLRLEVKKSASSAVARGIMKVPAMDYADISARIVVTDEGGAQIGTYRPNQSTGYYVLILSPGETYTISYEADGYEPIVAQIPVEDDEVYQKYDGVLELQDVIFGADILALQKETDQLNKETDAAAARTLEQEMLAAELTIKAKEQAEQDALAQENDAERKKAEALAATEKNNAATELEAEEERTRQAAVERKKAEALARFEVQQKLAAKTKAEDEARVAAEKELAEKEATEKASAEQELAKEQAELAAKTKAEDEARVAAEKELAEKAAAEKAIAERELAKEQAELAAKKKAEQEALAVVEQEAVELAATKAQVEKTAAGKALAEQELVAKVAEQENAKRIADAQQKRLELQQRIQALKSKQEGRENVAREVKEVEVKNVGGAEQAASINTAAIKAKREAMLARIEQLKKRKTEVEEKKVVDEVAVAEASLKEQEARNKKEVLEEKSEETKEEIKVLQKELEVVEEQVGKAEEEIAAATNEVAEAEKKVEQDIQDEKRITEERHRKEEEAKEAYRQIQELEELERKRIEQEKVEAEQFEKEQREEAERTKRELIQLEALAEQQLQVKMALEAEEKKKAKIEAAKEDAYSQEERLSNAETIEQLKTLSSQLIEDNLELKKQLAELNRKLDLILARLDYTPTSEKVELPTSSTMRNLQAGRRMILRNIFFDYNQASLRSRSKHELNKLFNFMKENPTVSIEVSGHTDSRGNDDYNLRLSKDRAQSVVNYLIRNGISSSRLKAIGYGETRPIARNENSDLSDNPVGRQLNRRIEISMPKGKVNGVEVEEIQVPSGARIK